MTVEFSSSVYICSDLKSYYASVECVWRGLDPLTANLLVADPSRSDKTICLAVSPSLKAIGVPSRPRLFEAKQKIREYEEKNHCRIGYIIAVPRMAEYERISAQIYSIYLHYAAPEDIHVYSIDECFIDAAPYLHLYEQEAEKQKISPAHLMAVTMIREVLSVTGITATIGIGTNMYLAKVAMDIVAKKAKADKDGVRIAEIDEDSYKYLLWDHQPLTDFWQIGPGKAARLNRLGLFTMGDVAAFSQSHEDDLYKVFGIDAEILIDHAWGIEPVRMSDIKNYESSAHSVSVGQVLARPYDFTDARLVFREMIDTLCADLHAKNLTTRAVSFWISFDPITLEYVRDYNGPLVLDYYNRLHPKHTGGTARFGNRTNSLSVITAALLELFDLKVDSRFYIRRLGIAAEDTLRDPVILQLDLFTDYDRLDREKRLQEAMRQIRRKYGANAVLRGTNLMEAGTLKERNGQIGGHKA